MQETNKFKEFLCTTGGKWTMIAILYAVIFLILLLFLEVLDGTEYVGMIFAIAMGVFGWKALSKIQPNIFLILPFGGWVIYFCIKGILSLFIGIFVAPFVIAKGIVNTVQQSLNG